MNICIYTSDRASMASLVNINYLIQQRPDHNYSFLTIVRHQPKPDLVTRLKKVYSELRFDDGRYELQRDLEIIDKRIKALVNPVDRKKFQNGYADEVNDEKSVAFLQKIRPNIIIQSDAGILKSNIFSLSNIATINVHHGLSPDIRGIFSTFWCLFYGIKEKVGVTCHLIDEHLDTGAVVTQKALNTNSKTFVDIEVDNYLLARDVLVESIDKLSRKSFKLRTEKDVKSYYFGLVNPFLYYALKKRNFEPLMKISEKTFKLKDKNFLEF